MLRMSLYPIGIINQFNVRRAAYIFFYFFFSLLTNFLNNVIQSTHRPRLLRNRQKSRRKRWHKYTNRLIASQNGECMVAAIVYAG